MTGQTILLIGTLDTKGAEYTFVRDLISARGHHPLVMDTGVSPSTVSADIPAEEVAAAAGEDLNTLRAAADRGRAVTAMGRGASLIASRLHAEGRFHGVLALGGSGGTSIATAAMRNLPVGMPKLMVSTMASADVRAFVGVSDICMMHSVADIAGLNRVTRRILSNAAGAICGMVEQDLPESGSDRPLVAATMFGVTTPCVTALRQALEAAGLEVMVFHATGSGGRAMEALIDGGFVAAVADVTTTEWCDELVGGVLAAGPHRLEAAGRTGIPQVVSCGALDMVNFMQPDTVPTQFRSRNLHIHNPNITLMRTTPEESAELGRIIGQKLNSAAGPTVLFLPLGGVSALDAPGQAFHDPAADAALFNALRSNIRPPVEIVESPLHINDPEFALAMATRLQTMLAERSSPQPQPAAQHNKES